MGCTMKDKNHIIKRVQEQFFRFGIKSLSMDEIAHQLGISKKTLYEMVSNKESLVELVITAFFEEQRSAIEGICRQATSPIQELFDLTRHISGVSGRLSESMMHDLKGGQALEDQQKLNDPSRIPQIQNTDSMCSHNALETVLT